MKQNFTKQRNISVNGRGGCFMHSRSLEDLTQRDQFRELSIGSIRVSGHKKGLDYHIVKSVSKHHLKDR